MNLNTMKILTTLSLSLLLNSCRFVFTGASTGSGSNVHHDPFLVSSSNYRKHQRQRYTDQLPTLQAHHQQNIKHFVRQFRRQQKSPPPPPQRFLQTSNATAAPSTAPTPAPAPPLCNATTGLVNFDDDALNMNVFGTDNYDATCTCVEDSNTDEISAQLNQLDLTDANAFVTGFNTLLGQLASSSNYTCANRCSSCFTALNGNSKLCGLFSVEESTSVKNKMGNFTLDEILNNFTADALVGLVDEATFYSKNCIQYTGDAFDNSELCFIVDYKGLPYDNDAIYCNITYNDVLCNSCIIPDVPTNANSTANSTDDQGCFIADCTNVDATYSAMINTCQNIGLGGPFQYFSLKDVVNGTTFTTGTCDGVATPTAPATTPSATEIPTAAPILISGPTSDDNVPSTKAPIKAPAPVPVLPAPVATPTSGTTRTLSPLSMGALTVMFTIAIVFL